MSEQSLTRTSFINRVPSNLPEEFVNIILKWGKIIKSPYSDSFYSEEVDWGYKPDKSFRVADHWNFITRNGNIHCQTTSKCPDNTHWTLAQFNSTLNKYEVIKSIEKTKTNAFSLDFKLEKLSIKKIHQLNLIDGLDITKKQKIRAIQNVELNLLNKYFKTLQEYA